MSTMKQLSVITPELRVAREAIALELSVGTVKNAVSFVPGFFNNISKSISAMFSDHFDFWRVTHLSVTGEKVLSKIKADNFTNVYDVEFDGLEGFNGSFYEYGQALESHLDYFDKETQKNLKTYRRLLADLITNANAQLNLSSLENLKEVEKQMNSFDNQVKQFFQGDMRSPKTTVGQAVPQFSQLAQLYKEMPQLANRLKQFDRTAVAEQVAAVQSLSEEVVNMVEAGQLPRISAQQVTNLADGLYALAKQIEFFGITYYRATVFINAVDRMTEKLSKF